MSGFVPIEFPIQNLAERAESRTLLQFRRSVVLQAVLQAFISEVSALQTAIAEVVNLRGPASARGVNLDAIGRIVGQDRTILDYSDIPWMTPDDSNLSVDLAPAWVAGADTGGLYEADDEWFRELIQARIARNFTVYSSAPEILTVLKAALGVDVSFHRTGAMEVELLVDSLVPQWAVSFIERILADPHTEDVMFSPFAATIRLTNTEITIVTFRVLTEDSSNLITEDGNYIVQ